MEYLDATSVACRWPGPVRKPFVCYDTAIESLLSGSTREELVVGILNFECGNAGCSSNALVSGSSSYQAVGVTARRPPGTPTRKNSASPAFLANPPQVISTQEIRKGGLIGFALGRVMAASTADSKLAASDNPAELLQLSRRIYRFTAQPPACSSQQTHQVAASKHIAVEFSDDAAANPLAQVSHYRPKRDVRPD